MTTAIMAINRFEQLLGTHESPIGSNNVPGITNFLHTANGTGTGASPWCCECVSRVLSDVGIDDFYGHQFINGIAYVPYVTNLGRTEKRLIDRNSGEPGDLPIFVWGGVGSDADGDHIGMVVSRNSDGSYRTIEGNSPSSPLDGLGDEVAYHNRNASLILGFYRPTYSAPIPVQKTPAPVAIAHDAPIPKLPYLLHLTTPLMHNTSVEYWQIQMTKLGYPLVSDGYFGPLSEAVTKKFQEAKKLTVDGIVGMQSWTAAFSE